MLGLRFSGSDPKETCVESIGVRSTSSHRRARFIKRGTKANRVEGEHALFGFLTTEANAVLRTIHPKAMPAILTTEAEVDDWMTAPVLEALELQRPLPDGMLQIVAQGEKKEGLAA